MPKTKRKWERLKYEKIKQKTTKTKGKTPLNEINYHENEKKKMNENREKNKHNRKKGA